MELILDIETNSDKSHIWMVVTKNLATGETLCHSAAQTLSIQIEQADKVIGHNLIGFDHYNLQRLWGIPSFLEKCWDTLIVSRLLKPDIADGHSLEAWGRRLGNKKIDYKEEYIKQKFSFYQAPDYAYKENDEWDDPILPLMAEYCEQDVNLTADLYHHLNKQLVRQKFSNYSVTLEHQVAAIVAEQVRNGVLIDQRALMLLKADVEVELAKMTEQLVKDFEPTIVQLKTKQKVIPFNPGSRMQIIDRLKARGWVPTEFTEKGNVILDEETLQHLNIPEAKTFLRFFELQKINSFLTNWDGKIEEDGRIHGQVYTNGAVTGRMTHSNPNLGQVPSAKTLLGQLCREVFTVPEGCSMVGIDASGLELRMLAHYMQDDDYIKAVCEGKSADKTDVHSLNQKAAGLATRDQAKTFIYAYLYGAGDEKIGAIAGGGAKAGKKLKADFLAKTPALDALKKKITRMAEKGSLPGLDGRRLFVRSQHKALNTLLQGAGAVVMKEALVIFEGNLKALDIPHKFILNVHDEFQLEVPTEYAEKVGQVGRASIQAAGVTLKLRCPLDGEYKVGRNWRETH